MDRWQLFEILLGNCNFGIRDLEKLIQSMDRKELEEGVLEFLITKKRLLGLKGA